MTTHAPDSRWWYLVLAVPLYYVLGTVLGLVFGIAAFVAALTGVGVLGQAGPGGAEIAVGLGVTGIFVLAFLLFLVGLVLSLAFPVAIYFDAEAVTDAVRADARRESRGATVGNTVEAGESSTTGEHATAGETTDSWQPDPALYGLLGLAGVVVQPLQVPLAVYYLYKRHEVTGVP
jgi:hypothetical protein